MPKNYLPLNFSINSEGRMSLWDGLEQALKGAEQGEMVFTLFPTRDQRELIEYMRNQAKPAKWEPLKNVGQFTMSDY